MHQTPGNELKLGSASNGTPVKLSADDRSRHLYVAGATRAGKSKFIEYCIREDIKQWHKSKCPVVFFDPHGRSYDDLVVWLAWNAQYLPKDLPIILVDLRQDVVVGYNVLRKRASDTGVVVDNFVEAMAHAFGQADTTQTLLFAQVASNIFWVLYELNLTLAEASFLTDADQKWLRQAMVSHIASGEVQRGWRSYNRLSETDFDEKIGSTVRRLREFVAHDRLNWMFGQETASFDWEKVLQEGAIVLINLSREKGRLSPRHAAVLGSTLLHDLWLAATERSKKSSRPCYVYADEFQRMVSPSLASSLAEASGFGLHLTLSHQFPTQLLNAGPHGKAVYDEVLANAQNKVVFHTEHLADLRMLAEMLFLGAFDQNEIQFELKATKVMGYREVTRETHTSGESLAEGDQENWQRTEGTSQHQTMMPYGNAAILGDGAVSAHSGGGSRSAIRTGMQNVSSHTGPEAVLGQEVSSVQFVSREWQLHRAMLALRDQEQRHFVAKPHNERVPVTLRTPNLPDLPANPDRIAAYVAQTRERWDFILPVAQARERIDVRHIQLRRRFENPKTDEPRNAKRPLPPPNQ